MEPLEQVTVLVTLMKRLGQVLDHERALLRSMPLEDLVDIQEEKTVLAEAYEIEFGRIRAKPEIFAALEPGAREQVETAMRRFQEAVSANMHALTAAQTVIEKLVRNVADSAARSSRHLGYGPPRPGRRCPRPGHPRRLRPQALGDPAMTITASLSSALSGLNAAQDSISVVAHNIANANTEGYVRKTLSQESLILAGRGAGVETGVIDRNAEQFLIEEVRKQNTIVGYSGIVSKYQDLIQDALGNPNDNFDIGTQIGGLTAALEAFASDIQTPALAFDAVQKASDLATSIDRLGAQLQQYRSEANREISRTVDQINADIQGIHEINNQIVRAGNINQETAELLDKRDLMIKQLSEKIEVRTYTQDRGAIALYTANGEALLDANPRVLYYDTPNFVSSTTSFGALSIFGRHEIDPDTGKPLPTATGLVMVTGGVRARLTPELQNDAVPDADQQIVSKLDGGRIQGLIDVRDRILPELNDELQELADTLRFAVNAAHNDGTAWPPPAALTGTNQDLSSFAGATRSGSATVAVIDHGDGTTLLAFEVDVAAAADDNDIVTQLNAGLGAFGTAAIGPDGNLTITLANPDQGLALAEGDSSITVADAAGRDRDFGFSHYFGLNDMFVVDGVEPSNLEVRADLAANPTRLSAAKLDVTTPPLTAVLGGVGDNRAARAVSQSLNAEYDMLARGKLPATNVSLGNYASQMIATAAIDAKQASDVAERDVVMSDALQFKEASFSGVNMDEELARLIQLQQAYTVAAKIVSAVDEMLDQLINAAR